MKWLVIPIALGLAACHPGVYRYVDQPMTPHAAHQAVISAAMDSELAREGVNADRRGADEYDVFGSSLHDEKVTIRTYGDGATQARTEIASETDWWLSPHCPGCEGAVGFKLDTPSQTYLVHGIPDWLLPRISFADSRRAVDGGMDVAARVPLLTGGSGGDQSTPTLRNGYRISASLGMGWDAVRNDTTGAMRLVSPTIRPGLVFSHVLSRNARPVPNRSLQTSWWATHAEIAIEPHTGAKTGVDVTLGLRVEPTGGLFVRASQGFSPDKELGVSVGLELGGYMSNYFAAAFVAVPLLAALTSAGDSIEVCWRCTDPAE